MVSKEKLIRTLDNAIALEEKGAEVMAESLMMKIEKSSLPMDKKRRLLEIVNTIKQDSIRHAMAIREAIEYVQRRRGPDEF
jgi:formylmethanofuran:tetrahydromethanopterin formyltransferase